MTMIRINLIAERKAGSAKAPKKTASSSSSSELQENLILLVCIGIAALVGFLLHRKTQAELKQQLALKNTRNTEYQALKIWETKKEELEIQKELLNEKIEKISQLKDNREGPVKMMEDVYNNLPESVWLGSIAQGYTKTLVSPTARGRKAFSPSGANIGDPDLIRLTGYARTTDAITNMARKMQNLDTRYAATDLNNYDRDEESGQYIFELFFKIKRKAPQVDASGAQQK